MLLQAIFCASQLQVAVSLSRYYIPRFVQVQTAVVGSPLSVSAAPVVRQSVISERPWGGGSGFCGAHCLLSIYALGFCRFLVLFWPAAQPPSLSAQPPVSPGELTHSVNNPLYSSPDLLCCSFTFGCIFLSVQYLVGIYHL